MNKKYIAPEAELVCFAPADRIAMSYDEFQAQFFSAYGYEQESYVEITVTSNPEGGAFD